MANQNIFSGLIHTLFHRFFSLPENKSRDIGNPRKFLIVRQHNQLGDLLAGVSLFRAIKEKYPDSHITLLLSPVNYQGLQKNKFIDRIFIFDKARLINPLYIFRFIRILKDEYDVSVVPVVVSISFTSNLLARLSNSKIRIGPKSLDGKQNESEYFFDRRVTLDWRKHPDSNVAERSLDIIRPFGITTTDYRSEITYDDVDIKSAEKFLNEIKHDPRNYLIGFHVGAGKVPNRWSLDKFVSIIKLLSENYTVTFFLTGSSSDNESLEYVMKHSPVKVSVFKNRPIAEVAALISQSDLFISNDTGIMHVAGTTTTPQISLFGPTNPFNWAPIGKNKYFIRKSELIDDISVQDVFDLCKILLIKPQKEFRIA